MLFARVKLNDMDKIFTVCLLSVVLYGTVHAQEFWEETEQLEVKPNSPKAAIAPKVNEVPFYLIGPGDSLNVFVWRNNDLSTTVIVRPDGRVSMPLVEDLEVTGKTPTALAREMEKHLGKYVRDPLVTVIVGGFSGPFDQQIRILGEATRPQALSYREKMTVLDVMIQVGGLTDFADGNDTKLIRVVDGEQKQFTMRLDDLVRDGDISANVDLLPGDTMIIPESWF